MKHQALQECFILKTGPGLAGKLLFPWKLLFSSTGAWCRCQWSVKGISALQPVLGQVCQNPLSPWVCSSSIFYSEIPPGMLEKSQLPFSFPVLVSEVPEAVLVSQHPEVLPQTSPSQSPRGFGRSRRPQIFIPPDQHISGVPRKQLC